MGTDLLIRFIGLDLVSRVAERAGNSIDRMENRIKRSGIASSQSLIASGIAAVTFGVSMLAASAAMAAFGVHSVEVFAKFRSDIIMASTHAGLLPADIDRVSNALLKMSPAVGFGPDALAQAFYHVQSASTSLAPKLQNVNSELDVLFQASKLAAIGHANLTDTTNALISVLTSYKDTNLSASDAAAILNKVVGEGNMTMQQLNAALANGLLPVAAEAGVKLQSVGAALGTLTDLGMTSTRASTYLRSAIIQMTIPSGPAAKALEAIGLSGEDAMKQIGAFSDILNKAGISQSVIGAELHKTGSLGATINDFLIPALEKAGLSSTDASALIEKAFGGIRSGTGVLGLTDNLAGLIRKEGDATDATSKWAATWDQFRTTDPNFLLQQMAATWQTLEVILGGALMPVMRALIGSLIPMVQGFTRWADAHQTLLQFLVPTVIALLALSGIALMLGGGLAILAGAFGVIGGNLIAIAGPLGLFIFGGKEGDKVVKGLFGTLRDFAGAGAGVGRALSGAIGYFRAFGLEALRMVPGLGSIGGLLVRFAGNLLAVPALLGSVGKLGAVVFRNLPALMFGGGMMRDVGGHFVGAFRGAVPMIVDGFKSLPGLLLGMFKSLPGLLLGGLRALPMLLLGGFQAALPILGAVIAALGPILLIIAGIAVVAAIVGVAIHDHWGQIIGVIDRVVKAFEGAFQVLLKTHSPAQAFRALLQGLGLGGNQMAGAMTLVHKVMTLLGTAFTAAVNLARKFWTDLVTNLSHVHGMSQALDYLRQAWAYIGPALLIVGGIILALLGGAFKALMQVLGVVIPLAIQIVIDIINYFGAVFRTIGDLVVGVVKIVTDIIHGNWAKAWDDAKTLVGKLKDDVGRILHALVTLVVDLFKGLWNTVVALVTGFASGVIDAAKHLYDEMVGHSIIPDLVNAIVKWFEDLPGRIVGALLGGLDAVASAAATVGQAIWNGLTNKLAGLADFIKSQLPGASGPAPTATGMGGAGITHLASGGLVTSATLALVGEGGPELVIPLRQITGGPAASSFMRPLSRSVGATSSSGGGGGHDDRASRALAQIATSLMRTAQKDSSQQTLNVLRQMAEDISAIRHEEGGGAAIHAVQRLGT